MNGAQFCSRVQRCQQPTNLRAKKFSRKFGELVATAPICLAIAPRASAIILFPFSASTIPNAFTSTSSACHIFCYALVFLLFVLCPCVGRNVHRQSAACYRLLFLLFQHRRSLQATFVWGLTGRIHKFTLHTESECQLAQQHKHINWHLSRVLLYRKIRNFHLDINYYFVAAT